MDVITGYKRSYSVVVRKLLNNEILSGYPRVYPTAVDVANGYFVLGGAHIPVMTQNELQNLTQSEYEARISLLKDYVIQQEGMNPFTNQFNENVVYDPENCVPQEITTTTTEPIVTTSTTTQIPVTSTTTTLSPITTTSTTSEVSTTTTTQGIYPVKYGALYNWYAATDSRKITSSDDWIIPRYTYFQSGGDLQILGEYLGGWQGTTGNTMKVIDTNYWDNISGNTNSSKFNGKGAGYNSGFYTGEKHWFYIWTNFDNGSNGTTGTLTSENSYFQYPTNGTFNVHPKYRGFSLRVLKTSTTLSDGQMGTYTGNDGKIYPTICIGTQEWLAENLYETKYRNGDWIHGYDGGVYTPISGAAWVALTTEAMCFYNDLESNG